MDECSICGVDGEVNLLFNAVGREGLVKICKNCSFKENIPIVKRASNLQLQESERHKTVYERLSKMAKLNPKEHREKFESGAERLREQDVALRKIVKKTHDLTFPDLKDVQPKQKEDLIRNYHWTIFNSRRARRITQAQVSEAIGESEASIKLVERGILPKDYVSFIHKLETYLGVRLFVRPSSKPREVSFDPATTKSLTLSDLQKMRKDKEKSLTPIDDLEEGEELEIEEEKEGFFPYWRRKLGFLQKKRESAVEIEPSTEESLREGSFSMEDY